MRAVVQRVTRASVAVDGVVGTISRGFLALIGVAVDDNALAAMIAGLLIV